MKLADMRKYAAGYLTLPVVRLLARTRVTPNALTWVGFWLAVAAAVLVGLGNPFAAGLVVLFSGFFDMLDGALARHTNQTSRFGGILDSTLDRLAEAALLIGLLVVFARAAAVAEVLLVSLALLGSFTVSYIRARVEAAGVECKAGVFTRSERVIVLALGLLLSQVNYALVSALVVIVIFSFFTAGQRLTEAWRQTKTG
jgi:CDP-diacylglycerol--glycerol-3-phosphate 3-phosphatidyltransferase